MDVSVVVGTAAAEWDRLTVQAGRRFILFHPAFMMNGEPAGGMTERLRA
jgi:hypothetical protein